MLVMCDYGRSALQRDDEATRAGRHHPCTHKCWQPVGALHAAAICACVFGLPLPRP